VLVPSIQHSTPGSASMLGAKSQLDLPLDAHSRELKLPTIHEDLRPAQDTHRPPKTGRPERVLFHQEVDGIDILRLDKPEATCRLARGFLQRTCCLDRCCVTFKEREMGRQVLTAHFRSQGRIVLENDSEQH